MRFHCRTHSSSEKLPQVLTSFSSHAFSYGCLASQLWPSKHLWVKYPRKKLLESQKYAKWYIILAYYVFPDQSKIYKCKLFFLLFTQYCLFKEGICLLHAKEVRILQAVDICILSSPTIHYKPAMPPSYAISTHDAKWCLKGPTKWLLHCVDEWCR